MPRVYATRADLVNYAAAYPTYTVPAEPQATALLTLASQRVEGWVTEPYDVDATTLLPTDADVAAGLRDAVCALVLRHQDSAAGGNYTTVSIGSVTLTGDGGSQASDAALAPDPLAHLRAAGLMSPWVATYR